MSKKSKSRTSTKVDKEAEMGMSETFKGKVGNGSMALNSNNMPKR